MARVYRLQFEDVSISAAQDLLTLPGPAAGKIIRITRRWISATDSTLPAAQMLKVRDRLLPATVTLGSGGTGSLTPSKNDQGDATCSVTTARRNDTTKATTSGTAVIWGEDGFYAYNGYNDIVYKPFPLFNGQAYVFELLGAPAAAAKFSAGIEFEEEG